jgi:poly(3-hydroxybutyrate) depolymerase
MKNLALLFLLALSSVSAFATAKPEKQTITSMGTERTYYTLVPDKLTAPAPLLLLLHGSGRDGMSQIDEWKGLAEKEGIILVAPDSSNSREWSMNTDGPEFLHDVVEAVRAKHSVDGTRLYIFGHSAGAVFALYMGVMESRYFAAAGVHAGAIGEDFYPYLDLAKRKIPVTIWVGTEDPYFKLAPQQQARRRPILAGLSTEIIRSHRQDLKEKSLRHASQWPSVPGSCGQGP